MKLTEYVVNFSNGNNLYIYATNPFQAIIKGMSRKMDNGEYYLPESVFNTQTTENFAVDSSNLLNSIIKK